MSDDQVDARLVQQLTPTDSLARVDSWIRSCINMENQTKERYLLDAGWEPIDGVGVLWIHDAVREPDLDGKPRVSMHVELALDIQRRRDLGWKVAGGS